MIDAVLFNNEYELLKIRFEYMSQFGVRIIIGESSVSFSGKSKPTADITLVQDLANKFGCEWDLLTIPLPSEGTSWDREIFARRYFLKHLDDCYYGHVRIFSDLDEFPSREQVILASEKSKGIYTLPMKNLQRKINLRNFSDGDIWARAKVIGREMIIDPDSSKEEFRNWLSPSLGGEYGCHISYFMFDQSQIQNKYENFSHSELSFSHSSTKDLLSLSDFFQISHVGDYFKNAKGLLEWEHEGCLTEFQLHMKERYPESFVSHRTNVHKFFRLWRSYAVTKFISTKGRSHWNKLKLHEFVLHEVASFWDSFLRITYKKIRNFLGFQK